MSNPFVAEVRIFAGNFPPRGWADCDGQLLPIAQHTALFSLIGTIYGGDGRTTTALPNLQGRAAMHPGRGPGLTPRTIGQRVGTDQVTLTAAQVPDHVHQTRIAEEDATATSPANASPGITDQSAYKDSGTAVQLAASTLADTGGNGAHENRQPYLVMRFIIALQGTYPSR